MVKYRVRGKFVTKWGIVTKQKIVYANSILDAIKKVRGIDIIEEVKEVKHRG